MRDIKNIMTIKDRLINGLIDKWGLRKFVKVVSATVIGAGASALVAESLIPDEPETKTIEKEND